MAIKAILFFMILTVTFASSERKMYTKEYNSNGTIKSEGWVLGDKKIDFWTFYHNNGQIASKGHYKGDVRDGYWYFYNQNQQLLKEGHYERGIAQNWWIFYDLASQEKRKIQYQGNEKNGFCLIYKKNKLIKAEKYENNLLIGTWDSIRSFRRDNPEVSLFSL